MQRKHWRIPAGFQQTKSTVDQLFTVGQTLRKCWEHGIDVYQLFIDFKQAYDSVERESLLSTMLDLGIPTKLVRLTKVALDKSRSIIKIQGDLGTEFEVKWGLRQENTLAPMLFNLALEEIIRRVGVDVNGNLSKINSRN